MKIDKTNNPISKTKDFEAFIKKFEILKLPLVIETSKIQDVEKMTPLSKIDLKFIDIRDINPELDNVYPFGILADTLETYKIIYLFPAESYYPVVATFNKNGEIIGKENLNVGGCGSDCGFTCNEYVKIYSDLKIYSVDSIQSYECDSLGVKENTLRKYTRFKNGSIHKNGKIITTQILEKNQ
ncbi:MAG: hypothetical protein H7250_00635 [Flavobacterium sp.]|nr:hypothetical protein [Flavobacterium sp.]